MVGYRALGRAQGRPWRRRVSLALLLALYALGPASAAAGEGLPFQLNPAQEDLLQAAAAGFLADDPGPARRALPALADSYMGPWVDYWALQPDLRRLTQATYADFAHRYPHTTAAYLLRRQWLLELARRRDWRDFTQVYREGAAPRLRAIQCAAFRDPDLRADHPVSSFPALWEKASPTDSACNAAARQLLARGEMSHRVLRQRLRRFYADWAYAAVRPFAAFLPPAIAAELPQTVTSPAAVLEHATPDGNDLKDQRELLLLALLRLAAMHPEQAMRWTRRLDWLNARQKAQVRYSAALNGALAFRPQALAWYAAAGTGDPAYRPDSRTLSWLVRSALRAGNWALVAKTIDELPEGQRQRREWRFWRAIADRHLGHPHAARTILTSVAVPWSYYGQLALAELHKPLQLSRSDPPPQEALTTRWEAGPGWRRALTLYRLGIYGDALREWKRRLQRLSDPTERYAAVALAVAHHAWLLGIYTSTTFPDGADWEQGYPLPYAQSIARAADAAGINANFLAGIIRQESGFAPRIGSAAGAIGLTQIMPATARWLLQRGDLPALGSDPDLRNPAANLALGAHYLSLMNRRFSGSEALAAAAYNAGPGALQRWLGRWKAPAAPWAGPIFVANIPYRQTRHYVEDVLANTNVYAAIMGKRPSSVEAALRLDP